MTAYNKSWSDNVYIWKGEECKEIRSEILTFIPARDNMLLNLYWPDWTGVVYSSVSLN